MEERKVIAQPQNEPRIIRLSLRLYGGLLCLGPKEFRQEYEQEVLKDFRHCCRNAYTRDGICGVLQLWPSMFAKALVDMGAEHFSEAASREKKRLSAQKQTTRTKALISAMVKLQSKSVILVFFLF